MNLQNLSIYSNAILFELFIKCDIIEKTTKIVGPFICTRRKRLGQIIIDIASIRIYKIILMSYLTQIWLIHFDIENSSINMTKICV